jgi:sarcosine oxidase subunit beta
VTGDVIVIGGGIIGLSVAYHLTRRPGLRVLVIEREATVGMGATSKATGGMRHQFSTEGNILLSVHSFAAYRRFPEEMGVDIEFEPCGYLFVTARPERLKQLEDAVALQRRLGVDSRLVSPAEAGTLFPALRADDLAGGTYCPQDGAGSPYAACMAYYHKCLEQGVVLRLRERVRAMERGTPFRVLTDEGTYEAPVVVNAAGAHADEIAAMVGVSLPAKPFRRQIVVGAPHEALPRGIPFLVDLETGWYLHRAADGHLLMGGTDHRSHPGTDETVDWEQARVLMAAATARVPVLEQAAIVRAYVGIRSLTPDDHAILGPVPSVPGFYLAAGLGGHGFMHAPAVGLIVSEVIRDGRARTIDLHPFRYDRFEQGEAAGEAIKF